MSKPNAAGLVEADKGTRPVDQTGYIRRCCEVRLNPPNICPPATANIWARSSWNRSNGSIGPCCTNQLMAELSLSPDGLIARLCYGDAEGGEAVEDCNTNLKLRDLTVEVAHHEALPRQFHAMRLCLDAASTVVSAPFSPERLAQILRARRASLCAAAPAVVVF
jgi:hypothetical protein